MPEDKQTAEEGKTAYTTDPGKVRWTEKLAQRFEDRERVLEVENRQDFDASLSQVKDRATHMWSSLDGTGRPETGWAYYIILSCVLVLTGLGLMMVLSASAVEQITKEQNPLALFIKQAMWAVFGVVIMLIISRLPVTKIKFFAWPAYLVSLILLALVLTPLGVAVGGNRNWLKVGSFTMQPSEAAKLALSIWSALVISRKAKHLGDWKQIVIPVLGLGGILLLLVLMGKDLGTSLVLGAVLVTSLWAAGVKKRILAALGAVAVLGTVMMSLGSQNRTSRISAWLGQDCGTSGLCDQAQAGISALASGGWFGVGLGESRLKWSWLPEAHNDFVFAIIGEELGFMGTLLIVTLFLVFTLVSIRVVLRYDDLFIRISGSCIIVWISLQAIINIAMVVGLLPVIGLPLPFISYGGSALTFTLAAVGVLLAYARHDNKRQERKKTR